MATIPREERCCGGASRFVNSCRYEHDRLLLDHGPRVIFPTTCFVTCSRITKVVHCERRSSFDVAHNSRAILGKRVVESQ